MESNEQQQRREERGRAVLAAYGVLVGVHEGRPAGEPAYQYEGGAQDRVVDCIADVLHAAFGRDVDTAEFALRTAQSHFEIEALGGGE